MLAFYNARVRIISGRKYRERDCVLWRKGVSGVKLSCNGRRDRIKESYTFANEPCLAFVHEGGRHNDLKRRGATQVRLNCGLRFEQQLGLSYGRVSQYCTHFLLLGVVRKPLLLHVTPWF